MVPPAPPAAARRERWLAGALLLLAALAAVRIVVQPRPGALLLDERDYLRAAIHLARDGVLSHAPLDARPVVADAYREPGYSKLLALAWQATGVALDFEEEQFARSEEAAAARRVARALHLVLILCAAAAGALAVRCLGGGVAAAIGGGVAVLASPTLGSNARLLASENLAAPLVTVLGVALLASVSARGRLAAAGAGLAGGLLCLDRAAGIVVLPFAVLLLLLVPRAAPLRLRWRRAGLFLVVAGAVITPWALRNRVQTGHFALSDRGGHVLWTRAELNRQVRDQGVPAAVLEWTPWDPARQAGRERWPEATFGTYRWTGEGNYFTRSVRRWRAERRGAADGHAVERRLAREAVAEFARHPVDHLATSLAVGWRGTFAERSPAIAAPFDLRLPLGLALLAGPVLWLVRSCRRGDPRPVALLTPWLSLFLFHGLATEFLPRYGEPLLPLAWVALVALLAGLPGGAGPARSPLDPAPER